MKRSGKHATSSFEGEGEAKELEFDDSDDQKFWEKQSNADSAPHAPNDRGDADRGKRSSSKRAT